MDFASLMEAASSNKERAAETKGSTMLKTKLSAPKKDERKKVDVIAIKRRLEAEQKKKEVPKPVKPKYDAKIQAKIRHQENTKTDANLKHQATKTDSNLKERKSDKKLKLYDNKQHEEKHNLFMKNVRRIGSSTSTTKTGKTMENADENPVNLSRSISRKTTENADENPVKGSRRISRKNILNKDKKRRTQAPNFQQLMALAEKVSQNTPANGNAHPTTNNREPTPERLRLGSSPTPKHQLIFNPKASRRGTESTKMLNETRLDSKTQSNKSWSSKSSQPKSEVAGANNRISDKRGPASAAKSALSDSQLAKLAIRNSEKRPFNPPSKRTDSCRHLSDSSKRSESAKLLESTKGKVLKQPQTDQSATDEGRQVEKKRGFNPYENSDGRSAWDKIMPAAPVKSSSANRYADSEDDYDDEYDDLDDFIDDADAEMDVSSAIRDIFGYDKRRYKDDDFDDRQMESRYADIMKEEVRSSKIASKEDLEEMRNEEEAKKRKLTRKKKRS